MKLTPAEFQLLAALDRVVHNKLSLDWLKPAQRRMVQRMRLKGLLSKRDRSNVTWTQAGKIAFQKG